MPKIKKMSIGGQYIPLKMLNKDWLEQIERDLKPDEELFWEDGVQISFEYEKPKLLKRPDGSLISEPEINTDIFIINFDYRPIKHRFKLIEHYSWIKQGLIFEISDKALAEKKAKQMEIQDEITNEIHRLNAEQGWAWKLHDRFFYFEYDAYHDEVKTEWSENSYISGQTKMSKKTMDIILEKYTQDELKQFLEILD